jgi:hypothetical protein
MMRGYRCPTAPVRTLKIDLNHAIDRYDDEQPGLGLAFAQCVQSTLERVTQFPILRAHRAPTNH